MFFLDDERRPDISISQSLEDLPEGKTKHSKRSPKCQYLTRD